MRKPRRWRKEFPYYKVQVFDDVVSSWKDERRAFDTVEAAQEYIAEKVAPMSARIVIVERDGRRVLDT
ncbi:MAG: hypothetical protein L0229_13780 [Blastocatellia bacterium]|nr:hypothetical protein [Blastocatellia bacterium]